jgi:putative copper export protein
MKSAIFLLLLVLASANAIELTEANWEEKTAGKTVFVKFLAPW